jgi:hypothetical protein
MLDGRFDAHGTIKDLRGKGVLDSITHDAKTRAQNEQLAVGPGKSAEANLENTQKDAVKKPRKLVKDEHREIGSVKWSIYKVYLKAS